MIKFENTEVTGWEASTRGLRNPLNSWDKSDSSFKKDYLLNNQLTEITVPRLYIGKNDISLMKRLRKAGTDHRKYLRFIDVYVDIEAPLYWWKEFKTYRKDRKFLDEEDFYDYDDYDIEEFIEMNSCSTMHKIHAKKFTIDDFSHEHLDGVSRDMFGQGDGTKFFCSFEDMLYILIEALNEARKLYLKTKDKKYWWQMIQLLPSSYNQRRTVKLTYEVLNRMYHSRKNHKLDEWRDFCKWIESLPYAEELITGGKNI